MTDYWVVNGHREDCAYLRSLDYFNNDEAQCDCGADEDDDDFWDEECESWH